VPWPHYVYVSDTWNSCHLLIYWLWRGGKQPKLTHIVGLRLSMEWQTNKSRLATAHPSRVSGPTASHFGFLSLFYDLMTPPGLIWLMVLRFLFDTCSPDLPFAPQKKNMAFLQFMSNGGREWELNNNYGLSGWLCWFCNVLTCYFLPEKNFLLFIRKLASL